MLTFSKNRSFLTHASTKRTKQRLLARWTERVVEVKDRELKIVRQRDEQTIKYVPEKSLGRHLTNLVGMR